MFEVHVVDTHYTCDGMEKKKSQPSLFLWSTTKWDEIILCMERWRVGFCFVSIRWIGVPNDEWLLWQPDFRVCVGLTLIRVLSSVNTLHFELWFVVIIIQLEVESWIVCGNIYSLLWTNVSVALTTFIWILAWIKSIISTSLWTTAKLRQWI